MKKKKILEISAKLNIGGAQVVAANVAKYADDRFHFHYIVFGSDVGEYETDIEAKGNQIFHWPSPGGHLLRYFLSLYRLMKEERYDAVHCHTMFNCGIAMLAAKMAHIPCRISHSHTTNPEQKNTLIHSFYRYVMQVLIRTCGNEFISCGVQAGETLYGANWFHSHGTVIPNGINIRSYQFSELHRSRIRNTLQISDNYVIGHVGHYEKVKNQSFLIELMPQLLSLRPNTVLLLFGDGSERENLKRTISELNLESHIKLMGNANNISEILSAFDVFAFPSLFEGTPLALIEAQANGLPCIISDSIPLDACLSDDVRRLSLADQKSTWIHALLSAQRNMSHKKAVLLSQKYDDVETSMNRIYNIFEKY